MLFDVSLTVCPHWLYPAHRVHSGQPEPLLHPTEIIPTGPVPAALLATLVQHCLQDRHSVQPNNVTQHGELFVKLFFFWLYLSIDFWFPLSSLFQEHNCSVFLTSLPLHTPRCTHTHILRTAFHSLCMMQLSGSTCVWPFTNHNVTPDLIHVWHCSHKI